MSVFFDNQGRDGDYEARRPSHDARARWSPFYAHRASPRRRPDQTDAPLWGLSYERAEILIQLALAFALVGGATAVLYSGLFATPPAQAPIAATAPSTPAPSPPSAVASEADVAPPSQPAAVSAAPSAAASPASLFDARPIADQTGAEPDAAAPQPLAPPSPEVRQKLAAQEASSMPAPEEVVAPEPLPTEAGSMTAERAVPEETVADAGGHPAKCFLKLAGRVQQNGACRVRRSDEEVVFQFSDKALTFAHERGRVWTATMGGRSLGRVYRSRRASCWGSRGSGFYACDGV